jgi:hypothetical protein
VQGKEQQRQQTTGKISQKTHGKRKEKHYKKRKGDQGRELQTEIVVLLISPEKFSGTAGWQGGSLQQGFFWLHSFMSSKHTITAITLH